MEPIFEGSAVALVLPMHDDGSIDYEGFKRQIQRMIDGGVSALLVNGTTGETATITIEEEFELTRITMDMAKGTGIKVIAGAGSNDTMTALKKAEFAKEVGADAILVVTPYYNKTSQRGLIEHFTYIADRVDIPMIIYNVPGRTGMNINVDTVVELATHKNIVAMKDATDNIAYAMDVLSRTADMDFDMYSGCDDNILPFIAAGGKGVISVLSNVYPRETEMFAQAVLKGDLVLARKMAYDFNDLCKYLFIDVNPIMPKAALNKMEVCSQMVRRPLIPTTEANKKLLFDAMDSFEKKGY
ncbi:MAG: 4-hydroxy-tetrahydrodipicolinate synthase [Coprobacillus sp.]